MKIISILKTTLCCVTLSSLSVFAQQPAQVSCPPVDVIHDNSSKLDSAHKSCDGSFYVSQDQEPFEHENLQWVLAAKVTNVSEEKEAVEKAQDAANTVENAVSELAVPVYDNYYCTYTTQDGFQVSAIGFSADKVKNLLSVIPHC